LEGFLHISADVWSDSIETIMFAGLHPEEVFHDWGVTADPSGMDSGWELFRRESIDAPGVT
jgi:hypothetical protein